MGNTVELTDANFRDVIQASDVPVLVDFWAPWCGPCRIVGPIVEQLAADYAGRMQVAKLNTDDNPGAARTYGIQSIPTLLFFRAGHVVKTVIGAYPRAQLEQKVREVLED